MKKKKGSSKELLEYVKKCNLAAELATAPIGLTFGQLLRGDAEDARKDLKKIIRPISSKRPAINAATSSPRRLKLVPVKVFGHKTQALFDSGAIPNLISSRLAERLGLEVVPTTKKITVADGTTSECLGAAEKVSISFEGGKTPLNFLVMADLPFDVIIGCPTMEALETCIDLGNHSIAMKLEGNVIKLPLEYGHSRFKNELEGADSKNFTSGYDSDLSTAG